MRFNFWSRLLGIGALLLFTASAQAAPYASNITVTGTTVNYILNQDADTLEISINGGAFAAAPDGVAKGSHTFTLGAASDTFAIRADKTEAGFTSASGGTIPIDVRGPQYAVAEANGTLISNTLDPLTKFNSPRGLDVNRNPNTSTFGMTYISNSAASAAGFGGRAGALGDGIYVLKADQSDGFGYGDTAKGEGTFGAVATTNTPFKLTVADNGEVYVAGFGDGLSGVWRMSGDLNTIDLVLAGTTGPGAPGTAACGTCLPVGQNHGSVLAMAVTGSTATNDLVLYTIDEDMTTQQLTRVNASDPKGTDTNKVWQYNIGGSTLPYSTMPTQFAAPLIPGFSITPLDIDRGADGKFYISQTRAQPANAAALYVTDSSGNVLFNSQVATAAIATYSTPAGDFNHNGTNDAADYVIWRAQQGTAGPDADADASGTVDTADYDIWRAGNAAITEAGFGTIVNDLYTSVFAIAVSPDQKYLAALHNNNTVTITPLVSGIPDIANVRAVSTGSPASFSARDIAWDAAGNLHIVSSGLAQYLVISPGGHTVATTAWNGSAYTFGITVAGAGAGAGGAVPEPSTLVIVIGSLAMLGAVRRRVR
jgi:hypothetical protein